MERKYLENSIIALSYLATWNCKGQAQRSEWRARNCAAEAIRTVRSDVLCVLVDLGLRNVVLEDDDVPCAHARSEMSGEDKRKVRV